MSSSVEDASPGRRELELECRGRTSGSARTGNRVSRTHLRVGRNWSSSAEDAPPGRLKLELISLGSRAAPAVVGLRGMHPSWRLPRAQPYTGPMSGGRLAFFNGPHHRIPYSSNFIQVTIAKALYTPGLGEQSGVLEDLMIKVYHGYRNIDEVLKLFKKKMN